MHTASRVLSVLGLFTMERPTWTVDEAMAELGLSSSTAYNYVKSLVDAGLLAAVRPGVYALGPGVIGLDRVLRRNDLLMRNAQPALRRLAGLLEGDSIALLCRRFRGQVMCVDQYSKAATGFATSYERGRPMPLYRGSASKVILSHMPTAQLKKLWAREQAAIVDAGLGSSWNEFRKYLRQLRKSDTLVLAGELDLGLVGVSAAIFGADGEVCGSVSVVAAAGQFERKANSIESVSAGVAQEAKGLCQNKCTGS